jgi:hypothetical protein
MAIRTTENEYPAEFRRGTLGHSDAAQSSTVSTWDVLAVR